MQRLYTKIKLEIIGADLVIENADISLEIKKTNEGAPNYCTCTIYNISENTYNLINNKTTSMRVYTDTNDNGYTLVFQGDLRDLKKWKKYKATSSKTKSGKPRKRKPAQVHYNEPPITREQDSNDIATIIQLQDGTKDTFLNNYYNKSYKGSVTNKQALNDILSYVKKNTTIGIGNIDTLTEKTFSKGLVLSGTLKNVLRKVCNLGNCTCSVENNIINILHNASTSDVYGYYLHGGICPKPEYNTDKEISVQAPYLPALAIGSFVKLDFQDIEGVYKVAKFESKIDNFGKDYETNITFKDAQ